jgi:hypothetical protein
MEINSMTTSNIALVEARDEQLEKFAAPENKTMTSKEGSAQSININNVVGIALNTFSFQLDNGNTTEQTVAVNRPPGAGFTVMLQDLYYAFVDRNNRAQLTERLLGQFIADIGLRGNELVCRVRLTDRNADDPVSIFVTAAVLFFN